MNPSTSLSVMANFNPAFCRRIVVGAAALCVIEVIAATLLLLGFDPAHPRCVDWTIAASDGSRGPIWGWIGFGVFGAGAMCWMASRWQSMAASYVNEIRRAQRAMADLRTEDAELIRAYPLLANNWNLVFPFVSFVFVIFCAVPFFVFLLRCP